MYKIREQAFLNHSKLSSGDGFLQYMIERLLSSDPPSEEVTDENDENDSDGDGMKLTSIQSITDFIACAGKTLPEISRYGQGEISLLPNQTKCPLKNAVMHSVLSQQ